jgi:large subunit ribosomal protein L25
MDVVELSVDPRVAKGSKQVARLRAAGAVPGVVYGRGKGNVDISISGMELTRHLRKHHRVFRCRIGSDMEEVYLQDVQYDVITDEPRHFDLKRIALAEKMEAQVEIAFLGHPKAASKGGVLMRDFSDIVVRCLPTDIPDTIEVNVSEMDLHDRILVKDLVLPPGVEVDLPPDTIVCRVEVPRQTEPTPAEAAPAEPALVEGKPAEEGAPGKEKE